MPTSDLAGSSSFHHCRNSGEAGTDPKTGLNPGNTERLTSTEQTRWRRKSAFLVPCLLLGPIAWMIEAAALIALIIGDWGCLRSLPRFVVQTPC